MSGSGIYAALKELPDVEILDTYEYTLPPAEMYERRRQALLVDLFVAGTNAVTTSGVLVNLDMIGNRTGAIVITSYSIHYTKLYECPVG